MLIDGKWSGDWHPFQAKDDKGRFVRQVSTFRNWITPDGAPGPTGQGGFRAEAGRYHLYVALICPWASRTLMGRALKGLGEVISVSVVSPALTAEGWEFGAEPGTVPDPLFQARYLHQIYTRADPVFTGRATVPVLWDKAQGTIVSNESADILRMLNSGFGAFASGPDLYPDDLADQIDALNDALLPRFNNGVYRAGFAQTQEAYDEAFADVFAMLAELEARLADGRPFLLGGGLTESDIRAFVTAVRFDAAYHGIFKLNLRRLSDHPNLQAWLERMLDLPGVAQTVNINHIKRGYYSIKALNPNGIVPRGPDLPWDPARRAA